MRSIFKNEEGRMTNEGMDLVLHSPFCILYSKRGER